MGLSQSPAIRKELATPHYERWLNEIVLDFGDYAFTRHELNTIGVGIHSRAVANVRRTIRREGWRLSDIYRMGFPAVHHAEIKGLGEVSYIVMAYCIAAANDNWDVLKWIGAQGRTVRGAVRSVKKSRR